MYSTSDLLINQYYPLTITDFGLLNHGYGYRYDNTIRTNSHDTPGK